MLIQQKNKEFKAQINLPGSKSLSNRALMIKAYANNEKMVINQLSEADDTQMLIKNLKQIKECESSEIASVINCGNAGTVFRFLVTFLASTPGTWMLTGSDRMKTRPVADLVDSLRLMGAKIHYAENEGFPPLKINGKALEGGKTHVSMEKSSQFASSLVLAAPVWKNGLELHLSGNLSSMPYLEMSLQLMVHYGAKVIVNDRVIHVLPVRYGKAPLSIESDWSSAAFWYELVALSNGGELLLKGLSLQSLQGDKNMTSMFSDLGVESYQEPDGLLIFKTGKIASALKFDLQHYPDMLPSLAATCAGLGLNARFEGLENLKYKESDRTAALQQQLLKINCRFEKRSEGVFELFSKPLVSSQNSHIFQTYSDHRMAMAFAPLAMVLGEVTIENPGVVEKSYPGYWHELKASGAVNFINEDA
jgi:3-phosphoshikimate 1-carboxyvinyltransferase